MIPITRLADFEGWSMQRGEACHYFVVTRAKDREVGASLCGVNFWQGPYELWATPEGFPGGPCEECLRKLAMMNGR